MLSKGTPRTTITQLIFLYQEGHKASSGNMAGIQSLVLKNVVHCSKESSIQPWTNDCIRLPFFGVKWPFSEGHDT